MTVLGGVFDSLTAMSQIQLLLAFMACIGYALAQGGLVGPRMRRFAWGLALLGAAGFALESSEWMQAAMIVAFAVAALGVFAAAVWFMSRALGLVRTSQALALAEPPSAEAALPAPARVLPPRHRPAHPA